MAKADELTPGQQEHIQWCRDEISEAQAHIRDAQYILEKTHLLITEHEHNIKTYQEAIARISEAVE